MRDFFINLFAFSGTAISILMLLIGWFLQRVISEKNKVLSWIVLVVFIMLAALCLVLRNILSQPLTA